AGGRVYFVARKYVHAGWGSPFRPRMPGEKKGKPYTDEEIGPEYLICLNRRDGNFLWKAPMEPGFRDSSAFGTPTVDGERVFAANARGQLYCFSVANGKQQWVWPPKEDVGPGKKFPIPHPYGRVAG